CFVFPRTAVAIEHEHESRFAANPNVITFYNKGQRYLRHAVSDQGDRCDWFAIDREIAREAAAADREDPFSWTHAGSDPKIYLQQRRIFEAARARTLPALAIEEQTIRLLEDVIPTHRTSKQPAVAKRGREMVYETENLLGAKLDQPLRLADIAAHVGSSVFHLCRTFRSATGSTIHTYLTQLRVRAGLEQICGRPSLSAVALDLGFTHHSHFSSAFQREFGATPSAIRAQLTS
ncbi:MAG TPA: AraC family transcriptional regulator, partial [Bryobacteraceae bacterium]|nr:AraC family transcriptional regulator [Bryobacteraceae bacterium]